jgi:hypothetical protein
MTGGDEQAARDGDPTSGRDAPSKADDVRTVVVRVGEEEPARRWPRPPRRVVVAGLALIVVIAVALGAMQLAQGPGGRHADGNGILASTGSPGFHNSWGREARASGPVTGAIRLCLERGSEPAVIESVGPDKVVGSDWHLLGASVRVFTPSSGHSTIVSMDGYPPPLPDSLQPAIGFAVTTPCGDVGSGPYTELLIGFEPTDPAGGGWDGIDVSYRVGGVEYVLVVGQAFVQCGTAPLPGYCGS